MSDNQTEYQIGDRLSYMRFLAIDLGHRIPDAKTIWLFRETLAQAGVVEMLFEQFAAYLADQGLPPRWVNCLLPRSCRCLSHGIHARRTRG